MRPGDAGWPAEAQWQQLAREVGDAFIQLQSPLAACVASRSEADCKRLFEAVKNPYFLSDDPALTQTLGWVWAWTSMPSAHAVAARRLRLVVKGGGHSYQGTSNARDSLRVWTRRMNQITVHDAFVGAPPEALAAAKDTAMNPAVLDAFALAISGANGPPAYPGVPGREPDAALARQRAEAIGRAMDSLRHMVPNAGSCVSESNFFEPNWQQSFWGSNHARLAAVKAKYDPEGFFFAYHGVGSEGWSADGFTRAG